MTESAKKLTQKIYVFLVGMCLAIPSAAAHPHAWITMNATLKFNKQGKVYAVYQEWKFDKEYSALAIEGLDTNKDDFYSPDELEPLSIENIKALEEYNYFTYLNVNGEKSKFSTVKKYGQYFANGQLNMSFTVPLKTPIDPRTAKLNLKIYDPTFYIAMDYQKTNPVSVLGDMPKSCKIKLKPVASDQEIDNTRRLLDGKGKDWMPDSNEEFGALFAQPLDVICTENKAS